MRFACVSLPLCFNENHSLCEVSFFFHIGSCVLLEKIFCVRFAFVSFRMCMNGNHRLYEVSFCFIRPVFVFSLLIVFFDLILFSANLFLWRQYIFFLHDINCIQLNLKKMV